MNIKIKSTAQVAEDEAKKLCIHGQSGIGKTMLAATAAPFKPLIILTEKTGAESLQSSNIQKVFGEDRSDILYEMDTIEAYDSDTFLEAVQFANDSTEHDLIIFDSASKASRLILKESKKKYADGRKAYGEHNDTAMLLIEELIEGDKHVVLLAHTSRQEDSDSGEVLYFPSFEGKAFAEKFVYDMPHVLFMGEELNPEGLAARCLRAQKGDSNKRVKTRGGKLSELNEPHLGRLILKLQGKKTLTTK
jgi:DNA polymerase III delta prime subunit